MTQTPQPDNQRIARFSPKPTNTTVRDNRLLRPSFVLFAAGAVATIGLVSWLGLFSERDDIRLDITDVSITSEGNVELTGAKYRGRTASGTAFEIIAETASEDKNGSGVIDLTKPEARLENSDGPVDVESDTGIYFQESSIIKLAGAVLVNDSARQLTMQTEALTANFDAGEMESDTDVIVRNNSSVITAAGLRVTNHGDRVIFIGNPKMTLHSGSGLE